jgi:hypothetical protein
MDCGLLGRQNPHRFRFGAALSSVVGLKTRRERIDYTCELFDTMIWVGVAL